MASKIASLFQKAPDLGAVFTRFPVAVISMAIFTLIVVVIGFDNLDNRQHLGLLCLGLIIGAYVSVSLTLASEGQGKLRNLPLQLGLSVGIAVLAWFSESLRLNPIMAIGAVILLLGNAVRWRRGRDDLHVWDFTHKLWTGVMFAVVGSVIFLLGMLFITEALKTLFGLNIRRLTQDLIYPIGFGFLAPLFWLSTLPPANEDHAELYDDPGFVSKSVAFLGTWLLAPLTLIYALILLAYGVKIVAAGSLPKGEIAGLTLPFLIIGTLTWLALEPPFIRAKALAKLFRRLWFPLSIPATIMLAIAVFVRINEYGYTPQRFALTIGVTWALGLGLWFTFGPKGKRDIRIIPGSAAALLLLGTFGAGQLSVTNQSMRFEAQLKKAGIMAADGTLISPLTITDKDAARKAKGAFGYLMNAGLEDNVAKVLSNTDISMVTVDKPSEDAMHPTKDNQRRIETALGLDKISEPNRYGRDNEISYYSADNPIPVDGFAMLYGPINLYINSDRNDFIKSDVFKAEIKDEILILSSNDGESAQFNPAEWIDSQGFTEGQIKADLLPIDLALGDGEVRIVIRSFNSWTNGDPDNNDRRINMDVYILTRGLD
ncbi:DUF4153 domain-containing protein [Fretibacter rubidus]|uniref:DUF4153 domain-containing protein n=1 Tax=Fretibacter rubidus TaxID=570162 RepID=UPI00352A3677